MHPREVRAEALALVEAGLNDCETLELGPRVSQDRSGRWHVRINRRESVGRMLEEVGLKT
jgi:hypothetical protein